MDFTVAKYIELLTALVKSDYNFQTFSEFQRDPKKRSIVLRHDVDLMPENSLKFARIQHDLGVKGVYYFRAVKESWDERIIKEIYGLGHEIGYHYESLTTTKGNLDEAIADFEKNLNELRKLAEVTSICMHGSPMSRFDSKNLWLKYDYRDYGIQSEPYFDVDFNKVFYLTDTGRKWNGDRVSVRDRVNSSFDLEFSGSDEIILAARNRSLPDLIMFTFHPQRWNDNWSKWVKELIMQNVKNLVKRLFYVR